MRKEFFSFLLALLFLFPVIACASGSYAAGDMTKTAIMTSMEQGNQVSFHMTLRQILDDEPDVKQAALSGQALFRCLMQKQFRQRMALTV